MLRSHIYSSDDGTYLDGVDIAPLFDYLHTEFPQLYANLNTFMNLELRVYPKANVWRLAGTYKVNIGFLKGRAPRGVPLNRGVIKRAILTPRVGFPMNNFNPASIILPTTEIKSNTVTSWFLIIETSLDVGTLKTKKI